MMMQDMNIGHYLYQYVKTNVFTFYLAAFLVSLTLVKYIKFPQKAFSRRAVLLFVILLGLVLRLGWLGFSSHIPKTEWDKPFIEEDRINIHAIELKQGRWMLEEDGSPSGHRPMGYPTFLGAVYMIFGNDRAVAWALQLLLYAATAALVYLMGKTLFSAEIGLLATLFLAVYPVSIYSIKLTCDEHLFLPLWYLGIFILLKEVMGRPGKWNWLWYGLLFGYAAMTRTHAIVMPAVIAFAYILKKYTWKRIVGTVFLVAVVMQLINLPWIIRNYKAWGVPVIYTTNMNYVYAAVNSSATPEGEGHLPVKGEDNYSEEFEAAVNEGNPGVVHKLSSKYMMQWIAGHPRDFLVLGTCRLLVFMEWNRRFGTWPLLSQYFENSFDPARPLSVRTRYVLDELAYVAYYVLFYTFIVGAFMAAAFRRRFSSDARKGMLVLGSCMFFYLLEHMVIYPDRKYRFPVEPIMMIFASYLFYYLLTEFRWEKLLGWKREG